MIAAADKSADPGVALRFRDLTLGYDRHPAVHHLNGTVKQGALLALVGPNGAGKSTLFRGMTGLLKPLSGRIERFGIRARDIAYLPQIAEIDRSFPIAVFDFVATGLWRRAGLFGSLGGAHEAAIHGALASVGLAGFEHRAIGTLSGGQMQRAQFARLVLQDARLILLDEPFSAIDAATIADLVTIVRRWHGEGRTIIAALHDLDLVRRVFPETLLLARQLVAFGPTDVVLSEANLAAARRMGEAFDDHAAACAHDDSAAA